jgi:hypothetical protein
MRILAAVLTVAASLAFSGIAAAATTKITGGTTTITMSTAASNALAANKLTVTPIAPATESGPAFSFPITGGRLNKKLHGFVRDSGGFAISNGTKTVRLRRPTIVSRGHLVTLWAFVRSAAATKCAPVGKARLAHRGLRKGRHGLGKVRVKHCATVFRTSRRRIARITNVTVSGGTATGTVNLTAFSAHALNALAGNKLVQPRTAIGTISITPTFG